MSTLTSIVTTEMANVPSLTGDSKMANVKTAVQFGTMLIGRADLSRAACEVALTKSGRSDVKEFARYELLEANTVIAVLKEMGIPLPPMPADMKTALSQIVNSPAGTAFDTAFMTAEHDNHAYLRDLAAAYIENSAQPTSDLAEKHGRQIASVAFFAFTEHTGIAKRILDTLAS